MPNLIHLSFQVAWNENAAHIELFCSGHLGPAADQGLGGLGDGPGRHADLHADRGSEWKYHWARPTDTTTLPAKWQVLTKYQAPTDQVKQHHRFVTTNIGKNLFSEMFDWYS